MLVLTRKIDQGIVIAGNIYIRVLGVERDRVKIGISAPIEITVLRQELLDREGEGQTRKAAGQVRKDSADSSTPPALAAREKPPANES